MPIEASMQEKSLLTNVRTQTNEMEATKRRIKPIRSGPARQEKSPSILEQSPVRGRSRISEFQLKLDKSSSVPEESSVKIKRRRVSVDLGAEEAPSESEHSSVKKRIRIPIDEQSGLSKKKSAAKVRACTLKNKVLYAKSAKQSFIKKNQEIVNYSRNSSSEKSPSDEVSRNKRHVSLKSNSINASAVEKQMDESRVCKNLFQSKNFVNRCSEQSPMDERATTSVEASRQEKSPSKHEQSPVRKGRARTYTNNLRQEKSLSKPVRRSLRISMLLLKGKNSLTVPEELCVKRKTPRVCVEHFGSEKSPSEQKNSSVKKRKTGIPLDEQSGLEQSPINGRTAISAEASMQEKSSPKPEKSPITRGKSRKAVAASRQEKSPSKPQRSPIITRGRSTKSVEAFKKKLSTVLPDQKGKNFLKKKWVSPKISNSPITRGNSRKAVAASRQEKSPSKPEQSPVKTARPTICAETFDQEKCPSKPEQLQIVARGNSTKSVEAFDDNLSTFLPDQKNKEVLKEKCLSASCTGSIKRVTPKISRPPGSGTITTGELHNEEGPLRMKPCVTKKRHGSSSVKTSEKDVSQTRSDLFQFENDSSILSSKRSPVKRKSSMAISHQNPLGPEASIIESETSPKVTEDQLNHSRQTKTSAKAKNKRAAPVDDYGVQSDLGENSLPIVERKENKMTASGKNNRQPRSEKSLKRTISHTHNKQSKDLISNGNTSKPANGLRRSSRYRVPPLDLWRNERLVFKALPSGDVQCIGIDKGTEEDNYGLLKILRREKKIKCQKKKLEKTVKKTSILDTNTGGIVRALVHRPFESLQWSVPPGEDKTPPPYLIAKAFTSKSMSFGFLDVSPFSTKETQYSPIYNLHFAVIKGIVEVTIHETKFTFEKGDSFIVPVGALYSVKNCSSTRALLSFSTFKEPFYPHQIAG
ncbi:CENP-C_C domain-containing protein [Trichonephila clavata]|uniref:CENP-C_C domain-containing protein n=1 Tax=Trichonephila clavata TaxID=2740835 RepID=A0A8X6HF17_TRICU|nr:CENP-C_C domain-containing protein [Trichonephila clavata]